MVRVCKVTTITAVCLISVVPQLRAQSCPGDGVIGGAYAFLASRNVFAGVPVTPPGTSGASGSNSGSSGSSSGASSGNTTTTVSNTPIGQLIGGVSGTSPFGAVGRMIADGNGNLLAAPTPTGAMTSIGTYTVNPDCSISLVLNDVFVGVPLMPPGTPGASGPSGTSPNTGGSGNSGNAGTGVSGTTTPTPATVTLQGMVVDQGSEIDIAENGTSNVGAVITLRRVLQFSGCSDNSLSGGFDVVLQWNVPSSTSGAGATGASSGALSLVGRIVANGAGLFIRDSLASQSPLQDLQITGTYTVADDCSGTAQLTDNAGTTHDVSFVAVQGEAHTLGAPASLLPELLFTVTGQNLTGTGVAKHE